MLLTSDKSEITDVSYAKVAFLPIFISSLFLDSTSHKLSYFNGLPSLSILHSCKLTVKCLQLHSATEIYIVINNNFIFVNKLYG